MRADRTTDLRGLVIPIGLVATAEAALRLSRADNGVLAPPSVVVAAFLSALADGTVINATFATVATMLVGLAAGSFFGLMIGILLGLFRTADRLMEVSIEMLRPVPAIALIPISLLVFGFGFRMEIAIVAFACLWPTMVLARAAVVSVEPRLIQVGRALGFGPVARIWKIVLPAALPRIFIAFRLSTGIALIVAVTVEVAGNPVGLGYNMTLAQQNFRPALMLALLIWLGVIGWAFNQFLLWTQRRMFGPAAMVRIDP